MDCRPKIVVTGQDKSVIRSGGEKLVLHCNPVLARANSICWPEPADKSQTQLGESSLQSFYLYLRNNLNSIVDYHSYRTKGCYPSSVLVEKAIALLVCRRLKLRGQNWGQQGADHLLVFRQMMLNVQWSNYWPERKTAGVSHSHTISHAYIMTDK